MAVPIGKFMLKQAVQNKTSKLSKLKMQTPMIQNRQMTKIMKENLKNRLSLNRSTYDLFSKITAIIKDKPNLQTPVYSHSTDADFRTSEDHIRKDFV
ncbi:hypothetical protein D3Z36_11705 [Lachnospiraceae bacterium]|nr:hypothetical protein [Lachnospiraceae bacterium]